MLTDQPVIDVSNMKEGDFAGLALLQRKFGMWESNSSTGQNQLL